MEFVHVAVGLAAVWLGILTLAQLALLREVALLQVRLDAPSRSVAMSDGLELGSEVPAAVLTTLPAPPDGLLYALVMSAICIPCRELALRLGQLDARDEQVVALLAGSGQVADEISRTLAPHIPVLRDPVATQVARGLEAKSTPFVIEIEAGRVTGKAYLHRIEDLGRLIESSRQQREKRLKSAAEVFHGTAARTAG